MNKQHKEILASIQKYTEMTNEDIINLDVAEFELLAHFSGYSKELNAKKALEDIKKYL